jgi:hypothetical protein
MVVKTKEKDRMEKTFNLMENGAFGLAYAEHERGHYRGERWLVWTISSS